MKSVMGVTALCFLFLLGLVVAKNGLRPCGCKPVYEFCANDYETYHSICEYKCKHPSTPFHDWFILYDGSCVYEPEITTKRTTTTEKTTVTTSITSVEYYTPEDTLNG